ncbi:hypothetical protein AC1031_005350 [Aphanomyces cochlioides]|nr:hypothetical protein AC1031_005350 [Aphanomyces cochlioides]
MTLRAAPIFNNCSGVTPCFDLNLGACKAGDASKHNGAGLVFCETPFHCNDEDFCYGLGSDCVCTGDRPCKPLAGACEAWSGNCSSKSPFLRWCPALTAVPPAPTTMIPSTLYSNDIKPPSSTNSSFSMTSDSSITTANITTTTLIIVLTTTGGVVALAIAIGLVILKRRQREEPTQDTYELKQTMPAFEMETTATAWVGINSTSYLQYQQLNMAELELYKISPTEISIIRSIGSGTYAEVFMGQLHKDFIAVKRLRQSKRSDMTSLVQFIDEIKLHAVIDCAAIVQFIGVSWTTPVDVSMVTAFMDQGDLYAYLQTSNPSTFEWPDKLQCAASIAHALVYLHSMDPKVIHRDLKSRNVLINSSMEFKVTDFGISRQVDDHDTMTKGVGTCRWMAPEVLRHGHYTESADIYSYGVILTELSTHVLPYTDQRNNQGNPYTDISIIAESMHGDLMPSFDADCPSWYVILGKRCMAFDVHERPTALEIHHVVQTELKKLR